MNLYFIVHVSFKCLHVLLCSALSDKSRCIYISVGNFLGDEDGFYGDDDDDEIKFKQKPKVKVT